MVTMLALPVACHLGGLTHLDLTKRIFLWVHLFSFLNKISILPRSELSPFSSSEPNIFLSRQHFRTRKWRYRWLRKTLGSGDENGLSSAISIMEFNPTLFPGLLPLLLGLGEALGPRMEFKQLLYIIIIITEQKF